MHRPVTPRPRLRTLLTVLSVLAIMVSRGALASAVDDQLRDALGQLDTRDFKTGVLYDRVLPLSDAAAAHKLQEENTLHKAGTLAGKIVLKP